MKNIVKIVCLTEPDISWTRNKRLDVGSTYWGEYEEVDVNQYGVCPIYTIYDGEKRKMGEYFARDFLTLEKHRDKQLEDILG